MYVRMVGGEPYPRGWQAYENMVIRSAQDPNLVIAMRPGAWQEFERHLFRGIDDPNEDLLPITEAQGDPTAYAGDLAGADL